MGVKCSSLKSNCCNCGICGCYKKNWKVNKDKENGCHPIILGPVKPIGADDEDSVLPDILSVRSIDLCMNENGIEHHTDQFELMKRATMPGGEMGNLVVRRGQKFKIRITFNRAVSLARDAISFIFTLSNDEKPSHGHGTLIGTMLKDQTYELTTDPNEWECFIENVQGDTAEISIKPAATASIGEWRMDIDTKLISENMSSNSYKHPSTFYVLFNPWCSTDQVYLDDPEACNEYVLLDTTLVWRGSYNRLRPSVWKLGQYEKDVLDCALLVISTVGKITPANRGDPIRISRALSAAVNSPDDDGVVLGNWSTDFTGGTPPTKWLGSVAIMQEFYAKRKPVKFGQCWIYAGVLSTIARAIGIPSRIITNYSSAHDTQASLTVDYFVDNDGKVMEELNSDSIWNYHVWNEVWMKRPDMDSSDLGKYDGWQAVDATPQETSDMMYRCGPASVRAVKLGEVLRPYDCNFLYAEVNADKVFWRYAGPYQPLKLLRKDIYGIGHLISTKAIGKWIREDITGSYKFAEKSKDERDTMIKALKQVNSAFSRYYLNEDFNDIYFNFELRDDIKIGEPFNVVLQVKNRSENQAYRVKGSLHVETVLYTGNTKNEVKTMPFVKEIGPQISEFITLEVVFDEYYKKLLDQAAFNISCMASVDDTEFEYFAQDDFRVRKPDIKISFQGEPKVNEKIDVIVRLKNPLPIPLHKGLFQLEGPGIDKQLLFKISEVPVDGTASATFKYIPPFSGHATIVAKFSSKELDDVDGFLAYDVEPRPEDVYANGNNVTNEIIARTDIID